MSSKHAVYNNANLIGIIVLRKRRIIKAAICENCGANLFSFTYLLNIFLVESIFQMFVFSFL